MKTLTCPTCGAAKLDTITIPVKDTVFEGVALTIPNAQMLKCPVCKEESYSVTELRRWQELKKEQLANCPQKPNATEVAQIRERLGLSIADFARLLDVTRQTIYTWERVSDTQAVLGPSALLVNLLGAGDPMSKSVFSKLLEYAHQRGQLTSILLPDLPYVAESIASPALRHCSKSASFFVNTDKTAA